MWHFLAKAELIDGMFKKHRPLVLVAMWMLWRFYEDASVDEQFDTNAVFEMIAAGPEMNRSKVKHQQIQYDHFSN